MGNSPSSPFYAVPLEDSAEEGCTPIFRAATHPNEIVQSMQDGTVRSCWDIFQLGLKRKGDGPFLGTRERNADGSYGPYVWKSYTMIEKMARWVGSGLMNLNLLPMINFPDESVERCRSLRLLGMYMKNREEWLIFEQAGNAYNFALCPLYDTMGAESLGFILEQTQLECVVCSEESIDVLLSVGEGSKLKTIIYLDDEVPSATMAVAQQQKLRIIYYKALLQQGKENLLPVQPADSDSIHTICYTSGTTGNPKGAIHTHRNYTSIVCAAMRGPMSSKDLQVTANDVHISYLPLAHVFERIISNIIIASGAAIGMYRGDTLKLLEDIRELKPTIFISVPRLFNRVNDKVFGDLSEKSAVVQYLFNSGLNAKLSNLRSTGVATHPFWDSLVFNKTKSVMGGRLRYMVVGGAPLSPVIQERMAVLFCCPFLEGYGMTETMGGSFITSPSDPVKGSVGGIVPAFEFKLQSVPEMEYFTTSDPPRGELLLRGPGVSPGYFRNSIATLDAMDKDGWLHTGDVSVLLPNNAVKIIDRAKNMFKLSQGEYVAPEKIEQVYQQAFLVAQVFCFGYSQKPMLVGIVVPDVEVAEKWAAKNGCAGTELAKLCQMPNFHAAVEEEMEQVAKRENLKGFEKIKAFKLTSEAFAVENDLITPTFKLKRHNAKKVFEGHINELYAQLETTSKKT